MNLKLLVFASVLVAISSCNKSDVSVREDEKFEQITSSSPPVTVEELRFQAFKVLRGTADLAEIRAYFSMFEDNEFRASKVFSEGSNKFSRYLEKQSMTVDSLVESISQNPSEVESVVKNTTSKAFYDTFMKTLSSSNIQGSIEEILGNRDLNSVEKGVLLLLLTDKRNSGLRSFSSCVKRYARLSMIATKAAAISLIDIQSGAEYASRELQRMKESGEYVC